MNITLTQHPPQSRMQELRTTAEKLEVTFATEMLKVAGLGKHSAGMTDGIGEDQFSSFMIEQQAASIVQAGGFGLSEIFLNSLIKMENKND